MSPLSCFISNKRFPRFVLKCELNLPETPNLDAMEQPAWWPPDMPFSEAILAQRTQRGVSHLSSLFSVIEPIDKHRWGSGRKWYGAEDSAGKLKRSQLIVCTVHDVLFPPPAAEICARWESLKLSSVGSVFQPRSCQWHILHETWF